MSELVKVGENWKKKKKKGPVSNQVADFRPKGTTKGVTGGKIHKEKTHEYQKEKF